MWRQHCWTITKTSHISNKRKTGGGGRGREGRDKGEREDEREGRVGREGGEGWRVREKGERGRETVFWFVRSTKHNLNTGALSSLVLDLKVKPVFTNLET